MLNGAAPILSKPTAHPRSVHLVDLENLMGSSAMSPDRVAVIRHLYDQVADVRSSDHVIVATGFSAAASAWFGWGPARRLVRRGIDGADLALLDVIERERLARRYERVVVASGDGIFAEACARLQREGCTVTVVTRAEALSVRLRVAVRDVRYLHHVPEAPDVWPMGAAA